MSQGESLDAIDVMEQLRCDGQILQLTPFPLVDSDGAGDFQVSA